MIVVIVIFLVLIGLGYIMKDDRSYWENYEHWKDL